MYLVVSAIVRHFDFAFDGVEEDHFKWKSDQFIVGIRGKAELHAIAKAAQPRPRDA